MHRYFDTSSQVRKSRSFQIVQLERLLYEYYLQQFFTFVLTLKNFLFYKMKSLV